MASERWPGCVRQGGDFTRCVGNARPAKDGLQAGDCVCCSSPHMLIGACVHRRFLNPHWVFDLPRDPPVI